MLMEIAIAVSMSTASLNTVLFFPRLEFVTAMATRAKNATNRNIVPNPSRATISEYKRRDG